MKKGSINIAVNSATKTPYMPRLQMTPYGPLWVAVFLMFCARAEAQDGPQYDPVNGNAAIHVIIPNVNPVFFEEVTEHGGDPSILIRYTTLIVNSWFDAAAPYHPTAEAVFSDQSKVAPYDSKDNTALNVAITAASKVILDQCFPTHAATWAAMLDLVVGEQAGNAAVQEAIAIGTEAGEEVWYGRLNDGMNHEGTKGNRESMPLPFADYTGYEPVNTAFKVNDPSHWQPAIERMGTGKYRSQLFVTPQYGQVFPYTDLWSLDLPLPTPEKSNIENRDDYEAQAKEVLNKSADLTEMQKILSEFFENKLYSLPVSAVVASLKKGNNLMEFIHMYFAQEVAIFDAGIWVWAKKKEFDAVRPFTAIAHLYGDRPIKAWGGPGKGTVRMPASNWTSYLPVGDHPEYPSGSACLCRAHSSVMQDFMGTNELGWDVQFEAGSSFVEPGITPAENMALRFETWDDFADVCGSTGLWSGVHFEASVTNIKAPCTTIGLAAAAYVRGLISGN